MRNRKLLGLLFTAANNTIAKPLSGGHLAKGTRPGIISLVQTHSGSMDWNCHLHFVVTDGVVDYREIPIACPNCGTTMDLKEFIFDLRWIAKVIPELSRAPPKITFARNAAVSGTAYGRPEVMANYDAGFDQTIPENDGFFNQACPEPVEGIRAGDDLVCLVGTKRLDRTTAGPLLAP